MKDKSITSNKVINSDHLKGHPVKRFIALNVTDLKVPAWLTNSNVGVLETLGYI